MPPRRIPTMLSVEETTTLLQGLRRGDRAAHQALHDGLYRELRAIAGALVRGRGEGQTLQPTALVHEAWLKLGASNTLEVHDRAHFLAIAAGAMRQILVDHARRRRAVKRGGGMRAVTLDSIDAVDDAAAPLDVLAVDECLVRLSRLDARQAQVVEMRVFAGMSVDETAEVLGVSPRTVELDWRMARAWLMRELAHADG